MLNIRCCNPWIGCLLVAAVGLAGCAPKTTVSASGNVPASYQHVYMTVQEVWFNANATASPEDTTWIKYSLDTPATVDLAASMNGQLSALLSNVTVPVGTYAQVRLIPVDSGSTLVASAQAAGATYNAEIDYTDTVGNLQKIPLELQNPDKGIGIPTSIQINGSTVNILASGDSSTTSPTATDPSGTDTSTTSTTTSSTTTSSTSTDPSVSSKPFTMAINVDGAKDFVTFNYAGTTPAGQVVPVNGVNAILLNPHLTAYNTNLAGAVQGTLNLANVSSVVKIPGNTSFVDIQVTAESVSTDGTRHTVVASAPVAADGTFTLYPLATSSNSPTSYDLVIHGKAIATVIVQGVTVNPGDPTSTTPVNVGTITPRATAQSFRVNLNTTANQTTTVNQNTTPLLPAGTLVGFYQTLPGSTQLPYVIELRPIDPFNRAFAADQVLPTDSIDFGTFSSSGSTISMSRANPTEGAATYGVATTAPLFVDGVLTGTGAAVVTPPSGNLNTTTTLLTLPFPIATSGITGSASISVTVTNRYDQGQLIVSHDGAIVATAPLDSALGRSSGTTTLPITGLPAGSGVGGNTDDALYYVSVRVWRLSDPSGTLVRETYPAPLDLRTGSNAAYSLTIN